MPHVVVLCADGIAMLRRFAIQVRFYTRAGWHYYDYSGRGDMLLNHKHKTATNISRRQILSNDTRPPSDLPVSSGLSFLDRESGDSRGVRVVLKRGGGSQPPTLISLRRI